MAADQSLIFCISTGFFAYSIFLTCFFNMATIFETAADEILVISVSMVFLHTASSRCWLRAHELVFFKMATNMAAILKMAADKIMVVRVSPGHFAYSIVSMLAPSS